MLNFLYETFFTSTPDCNTFWKGSTDYYEVNGGRMCVTGEGPVGVLTFDVHDDQKEMIQTRLIVKSRAELVRTFEDELKTSPTPRESLLSDWVKFVTRDNTQTVVFSDNHSQGFIFEHRQGFPFELLKTGGHNRLTGIRYFQERDFLEKINKRGYTTEFLEMAAHNHPEKYQKLVNNLESAYRALDVISLDDILGLPHKDMVYPQIRQSRCSHETGIHIYGCNVPGNPKWSGQVESKFGTIKINLTRDQEKASAVFKRADLDVEAVAGYLDDNQANQLLHKWWISNTSEGDKIKRQYICPELKEVLFFEGDKNFPLDQMDSEAVNHQFFLEVDLDRFMRKHGLPLEEAVKIPGWTEAKLQSMALWLERVQGLVEKDGVSLDQIASMDENKFCYLLVRDFAVREALNFVSLEDIYGVPAQKRSLHYEVGEEEVRQNGGYCPLM